jgi:hypothetical protein
VNFAELPSTITGLILLVLREVVREKQRTGMDVEELLESALKQTTANEDRIKELLDGIRQDMQ